MATPSVTVLRRLPSSALTGLRVLLDKIEQVSTVIKRAADAPFGVTVFEVMNPILEQEGYLYSEMHEAFSTLENLRALSTEFGSSDEALVRIVGAAPANLSKDLAAKIDAISAALKEYDKDSPIDDIRPATPPRPSS
jgi:hypothetical protein